MLNPKCSQIQFLVHLLSGGSHGLLVGPLRDINTAFLFLALPTSFSVLEIRIHSVHLHSMHFLMHSNWISLVQDLIEARMTAQFQSEVNIMAKIDHLCLVKLIGYFTSSDSHQQLLCYELIPNGNLEQWLHGEWFN